MIVEMKNEHRQRGRQADIPCD